jgi:hypothetical protein
MQATAPSFTGFDTDGKGRIDRMAQFRGIWFLA